MHLLKLYSSIKAYAWLGPGPWPWRCQAIQVSLGCLVACSTRRRWVTTRNFENGWIWGEIPKTSLHQEPGALHFKFRSYLLNFNLNTRSRPCQSMWSVRVRIVSETETGKTRIPNHPGRHRFARLPAPRQQVVAAPAPVEPLGGALSPSSSTSIAAARAPADSAEPTGGARPSFVCAFLI